MKALSIVLIIIGLLVLIGAFVGRVIGNPRIVLGHNVLSVIIFANTMLLLAVLAKFLEKK